MVGLVRKTGSSDPCSAVVTNAAALDDLLNVTEFDQIVCLPQLTNDGVDFLLDRIDGPRWIVFSSAQLDSAVRAPGLDAALARERLAIHRGAVVIRPTMIFGRGGDQNISRLVRSTALMRVPVLIDGGRHLVQPVHVDDVVSLVALHRESPVPAGLYPVGGAEVLPARELLIMIAELLGVRFPAVNVPGSALRIAAIAAPLAGLRRDQLLRISEDKTVDTALTTSRFGWEAAPLAHRLEQAVTEVSQSRVAALVR